MPENAIRTPALVPYDSIPQTANALIVFGRENADIIAEAYLKNRTYFIRPETSESTGYYGVRGVFERTPIIVLSREAPASLPSGLKFIMLASRDFGARNVISIEFMRRQSSKIDQGNIIIAEAAHLFADGVSRRILQVIADLPKGGVVSAIPDRQLMDAAADELRKVSTSGLIGSVLTTLYGQAKQPSSKDLNRWRHQGVVAGDSSAYALYVYGRGNGVRTVAMGVASSEQEGDQSQRTELRKHLTTAGEIALKTLARQS